MLCWADADDGSDDSVFGCQGAAGWDATEGPSPASVLLFTVADDGEGEGKGEGDGDDRGGVGGGIDGDIAGAGGVNAGNQVEQRALAAARAPHQTYKLARVELAVERIEHHVARSSFAVAFGQPFQADQHRLAIGPAVCCCAHTGGF